MSTTARHARHRSRTVRYAVAFLAISLFLAALFAGPGNHAATVPGPQMVLRPPAASQQITVTPGKGAMQGAMHRAAMHRAHERHLAEEHKRHLASLRHKLHELHEERAYY